MSLRTTLACLLLASSISYAIGYRQGYNVTYQEVRAMTADLLGAHKCQH